MVKRVLTIAGSDSGGGAGVQADLKTFHAFGVYGMSVITAVTAQNTVHVNGVEALSPGFVALQIESVLSDIGVDAVKTGMLFNADIVFEVSRKIRDSRMPFVVVDPVMVSKGGSRLVDILGVQTMKKELLPLATLVTPNVPEAEILSGVSISSENDMVSAAKVILESGCRAVLVKGGHLPGDAVDLLYNGEQLIRVAAHRIDSVHTHGTGCTLSAAITACLARGKNLQEAVQISKDFILKAIESAFPLGKGHGPLNHFIRPELG